MPLIFTQPYFVSNTFSAGMFTAPASVANLTFVNGAFLFARDGHAYSAALAEEGFAATNTAPIPNLVYARTVAHNASKNRLFALPFVGDIYQLYDKLYYSNDGGSSWSSLTIPTVIPWVAMATNNNDTIVLTGYYAADKSGMQVTYTSTNNGQSWQNVSAQAGGNSRIFFMPRVGRFITGLVNGGANSTYVINLRISPDGVNWSTKSLGVTSPSTSNSFMVIDDGTQLVLIAQASANQVHTSPDGLNWTQKGTTGLLNYTTVDAAYGNGLYVVTTSQRGVYLTSTNLTNWSAKIYPEDMHFSNVEFGNGEFVFTLGTSYYVVRNP